MRRFLPLMASLALLLAPLSPAADFTDAELLAFQKEAQEVYRIGTDEPRALQRAIDRALASRR